ncbi:BCCT family transporter [Natrialba asiatica]|uniref:Choline/carnitine/betaine transporter n=1 Tax=Natrialba asiatica (strain ATCC 700177 / DSM 12278 / JCM 9576 / FERM P-10747 / NBRC 102637 / 172P1) TaxID=29540 RepID=M0AKQ0_NATA1|nr:BCCT family transporter [Natrialba asiatica]ELY97953.1 choline/carnitine/betaine transporter [Natrialba asiatica DSM 12278]
MTDSGSQRTVTRFRDELDSVVFGVGFVVAAIAVLAFILRPDRASEYMNDANEFLWTALGWWYLIAMFILVAFVAFLIFGPWGNITLGDDDEEPEFSFLAYFAMLYSAGIAAGIVFWGPAEAIFHYDTVSPFIAAESQSSAAAVGAVQYTFFHWGVSAWTAYVVMALPIAYYAYRYDAPLRISTVIAPWVGLDNLDGPLAKVIDILAVFATIGGVATTLGLVGNQFLVGVEWMTGASVGDAGTVLVITGLTVAFTISVALGVRKGIRRISYFNMALFALLTVVTFVLGPTTYIMSVGTEALGAYINQFVTMSFYTGSAETAGGAIAGWVGDWTIFYWAWWFSWMPFVGLFIARISRGRTVRQVAVTGVVASTGVTIPWFATMGATGIFMQQTGRADILSVIGELGEAGSGYPLFEALPLGGLLTVLFLVLVTTFLVTSADSSTLALGMLTTGGAERPSTINRVIWGVLIGALASLLMVTGGVDALQAAAIITGGPFSIIALLAVASMAFSFGTERPLFLREEDSVEMPGSSEVVSGSAQDDD